MIQDTVFVVTLALMIVVMSAFVFVAWNASKGGGEYAPIQAVAYQIRSVFFWTLVVAGIPITIVTTLDLPFAATRGDFTGVDKQVDVTGHQWYWAVSDSSASVGDTVVFNVGAADVTHGLGIYDEQMRMLGQTQAMPSYSNSLKLTFDKPGTYKLMCMEYCGVAHHAMVSEFTVSENQ